MKNLTLKQLRYVDALARHSHFGRAAAACSVSQPALSVQIRELEATLGTLLFERGGRQVRLTRFGETFAERVSSILLAIDELGELARASGEVLDGEVRLGVIPTIAPYLLPRVLGGLSHAFPGLDLRVRETITPRLLDELSTGRLDAAIVALPISEPELSEVALREEPMLLVRHKSQAGSPVPSVNALGEHRLLLLEEGHCFRDQALAFCELGNGPAREGLEGTSLSTLVQMVGAGMGVTLIPAMAADVETRAASITVDRFADPQPSRTVGIVWRRSTPLAGHLTELAEYLRGCLDA